MMPEFKEPYHGRPITFGEIGCFMSHYNIWNDIIDKKYSKVVVFEDDVRFEPYFRSKMQRLLAELETLKLEWDLVFLGRKILGSMTEPWLEKSEMLLHVNYTYWTLGYMLSNAGAQKLVLEEPLSKIVPVDEYLPIMYDRHPKEDWKSFYRNRDLKAFSVQPLFVYPTHYVGEDGYLSDTEDSLVMQVPSCESHNCDQVSAL
jgi:collagen beta-1,O-galactosyltransferase